MSLPEPIIKAIGVAKLKANQSVRNNELAKKNTTLKQLQSGKIDKHTITTPRTLNPTLIETTNDHQPIKTNQTSKVFSQLVGLELITSKKNNKKF
jgi:hypothetical protein